MISVMDSTDSYLTRFMEIEKAATGSGEAWLLPTRKAAFARFSELGFPTIRDEEWRFTNVSAIAEGGYEPCAMEAGARVTGEELSPFAAGDLGEQLLVFVNGRFEPSLSHCEQLDAGLSLANLGDSILADGPALEPFLARHAAFDGQAFTALNTAMFEDGAVVRVAKNSVVGRPVHLLYVSTAAASSTEQPFATFPRNLIVAEENSQVTVVETYLGIGQVSSLTNTVTEIVGEAGSTVEHFKIIRESIDTHHMADLHITQGRGSRVSSLVATFGGSIVRNDINANLDGEGGNCTLNGLSMIGGQQHVDNHLRVIHAEPHCDSWEYFKGIYDGSAVGVFSGRIIVRKDAQKTDAKQTNKSLILSKNARAESKPQLEILADDVKCTHGVTIGQVNPDEVFYLMTRGVDESAARRILVRAFAQEGLDRVSVPALREQLEALIGERLLEFFSG